MMAYACPTCAAVSHHPMDEAQRYCARCKAFEDEWRTFEPFLGRVGYLHPRRITGGRYAAIAPMIYTHAIITGRIGDYWPTDDLWCYRDLATAKAALDAWDGTGEPEGWHRHPMSGHRPQQGDPLLEELFP